MHIPLPLCMLYVICVLSRYMCCVCTICAVLNVIWCGYDPVASTDLHTRALIVTSLILSSFGQVTVTLISVTFGPYLHICRLVFKLSCV